MRSSLNPFMYKLFNLSYLYEKVGTYTLSLSQGKYLVFVQGAGGAEEGRRLCQKGLRMVRGRHGGDPVPAVEGPVLRQGGDRGGR
mgnify:CR=1 FL=1